MAVAVMAACAAGLFTSGAATREDPSPSPARSASPPESAPPAGSGDPPASRPAAIGDPGSSGKASPKRRAVPGAPRVGRADLTYPASFTTAAGRTARRHGVLDGTVEGRFGPAGERLTAAFVRLEVTSRWPLVTGSDVRDNSGYLVHIVDPPAAAEGARVSARLRMGDSSYRLAPPRVMARDLLGAADAPLAERLPDLPALSAMDLDGDGDDEIVAFFRRQLAMSARPEARMHVFRIEGRAVVDTLSLPVIIPDVTDDFDFWGYLIAEVKIEPAAGERPPAVSVAYARTAAAEDQRTDAAPPRAWPPRAYTVASR